MATPRYRMLLVAFLTSVCLVGTAQAQKGFGDAVLVSGDRILVGEPDNLYRPGAVYIFHTSDGEWMQEAVLTAADAEMNDGFGASLAMEGDLLVVGSSGTDGEAGSAHVFHRMEDGWMHHATLMGEGVGADDAFGATVGLSDGAIFVGAPAADSSAGAAYVFEQDADGMWMQAARLEGSEADAGVRFGTAIAAADGRAFVGAHGGNNAAGGVYLFERDADSGAWTEMQLLKGRVSEEGDRYGASLDLMGDELLVGIPRFANRAGGAIMYRRDEASNGWESTMLLLPFAASNPPAFAMDVALDGDEIWSGAPYAAGAHGNIYRFKKNDDGAYSKSMVIDLPDLQRGDLLGSAVDISGGVAVAGLSRADFGAGVVAVFEQDDDGGWEHSATLRSPAGDGLEAVTGDMAPCTEGEAGIFSCEMVDMLAFLPISELGGERGVQMNDIWGWTDPESGREYAIIGRMDGTSFVDVTDPSNPAYLGNLPKTEGTPGAVWRDIKVYKNHAFIVADAAEEHGVQIFDLTHLRDVGDMPVTFEQTAHYDGINSAHNIVINEDTGFAYTVGGRAGGETCGGGLHMINIQDPTNPVFAGCYSASGTGRAGTGYSHDAQCLVYRGPDSDYAGRELCFGSNETALNIADVTDKDAPVNIATAAYPSVSYTHQGWISDDHEYFFVNDELDEISGAVPETRTLIWDITDIDDPQLIKEYTWGSEASDHNLYIRGNLMYQSNYVSGLRIHDVSDPMNPREVGYFDTMPVGDNDAGFAGSWSNYPFFESGTIVVSSIGEGLFILKKKQELGL